MITTPTVFILGAGASAPYRYPTAKVLKGKILESLSKPGTTDCNALITCGCDPQQIAEFCSSFRLSAQFSVDAFLERRQEFLDVGKAAIAQQLIKHESPSSRLFDDEWYAYLLGKMDAPFERFHKNNVSFVTFNYDRSLEYFLSEALINRYNKTQSEVTQTLSQIPIIHVYGQLGFLDWQSTDQDMTRTYGSVTNDDVMKAANGIKIVSEGVNDTDELQAARECISEAQRIIFLGFGYNAENMRRLAIPWETGRVICGSSKGFTPTERQDLTNRRYHGLVVSQDDWDVYNYLRNEVQFAAD